MLSLGQTFKRIYRPVLFQGQGRRKNYFEGWYFKFVFDKRAYAFIPGISLNDDDAHSFVQILDGRAGTATYHRYDREAFSSGKDDFFVEVGPNFFSLDRVHVETEEMRADLSLADLHLWPSSWNAPGAMGWYTFVPFMQCYHGIVAMNGSASGTARGHRFDQGRFYLEKDWGTGFPGAWIWLQCNNFSRPRSSLSCSVATVPWLTGEFTGFIAALLVEDELYRFTTYTGAKIERIDFDDKQIEIVLKRKNLRLHIHAERSAGADLVAPNQGEMRGRVNESLTASVKVTLQRDDVTVFQDSGSWAGLEVVAPDALNP